MATSFTAQHPDLLEASEKVVFFQHLNLQKAQRFEIFEELSSNKAYEDRMRVAGLGRVATKPEGTPVAFDTPISGTVERVVHSTYALGWRATMEMLEDELFGVMSRMTKELALSVGDHQERLAWGLIDDGYAGNTHRGLENEVLFSSTHANIKLGGTQSNILSPAVALGATGIEAMLTLARTTTSDEGRFIDLSVAKLLIHPAQEFTAKVLLDTEYEVDSSNNNINTVHRSRTGISPVMVPYLSSQTNWSLHAPSGQNGIKWYNRKSPDFMQAKDSDTMDLKHYAYYRAMVAFDEWRGNFGSQF